MKEQLKSLLYRLRPGSTNPLIKADVRSTLFKVIALVVVSYFVAAASSSFVISVILGQVMGGGPGKKDAPPKVAPVSIRSDVNYVKVRRDVLGRNLFNSEGEFPDEEIEEEEEAKPVTSFDMGAKCVPSTLPLTLIGTIVMPDERNTLATVREKGFSFSDVYKVGDTIIGQDGVTVVRIERKKMIMNAGGVKECITIKESKTLSSSSSSVPAVETSKPASGEPKVKPKPDEALSGECVPLESSWVEGQLGEGMSTIINSARLVPNMVDNKVSGFKIFSIKSGTLFDKAGFRNGDIIEQVGSVSLQRPEQGFALYEAFENEEEINVSVLRGGKTPKNISVCIK